MHHEYLEHGRGAQSSLWRRLGDLKSNDLKGSINKGEEGSPTWANDAAVRGVMLVVCKIVPADAALTVNNATYSPGNKPAAFRVIKPRTLETQVQRTGTHRQRTKS